VYSGGQDEALHVWNVQEGKRWQVRNFHAALTAVAVSPQAVFLGLSNGSIGVLQKESGNLLRRFAGHDAAVTSIIVVSGKGLVTSGRDGKVQVCDPQSGDCIASIQVRGLPAGLWNTQ